MGAGSTATDRRGEWRIYGIVYPEYRSPKWDSQWTITVFEQADNFVAALARQGYDRGSGPAEKYSQQI
ncbi:MAG: hypothetical protein DMG64_08605, partial [Acidobacteria bacterium]